MNGGINSRGYTILETMIFLAVSGLMFVTAATFISGRQQKVMFREGMNKLNSQVQQAINDVGNGIYPSNADFTCDANQSDPAPSAPAIGTATSRERGTNQGCVFMGKVIQFGIVNPRGPDEGYNIYTVIGRQYKGKTETGTLATSFGEAKPRVMFSPVDLTGYRSFEGPIFTKMVDGGGQINAIGFFTSFGSYQSANTLSSGGQSIIPVVIPGTLPSDAASSVSQIQTNLQDSNIKSNVDIAVCFESGSGSYGKLTIGGASGQRLATRVQIGDSTLAGC